MWDDCPATCWLMHCSMHWPMQGPTLWRMLWLGSDSLSLPIFFFFAYFLGGFLPQFSCWQVNLLLFDAAATWLPGSASPYGYFRHSVLNFLPLILSLLSILFWARVTTDKDRLIDQNEILSGTYKLKTTTIIFIRYYIHAYAHAALLAATFLAAMASKK